MDFLNSVLFFVVAIGVLVTVHELGHFLVAKRLGVKILRFSVGFGRPIWSRRSGDGETEYALAAIPLGGYVKMLDEREGEVPEAELPRAFNRQRLGVRIAIVAAGPLFNFFFAILIYWLMFSVGTSGLRPLVDEVKPGSVAEQARLSSGDEIIEVAGEPTVTWERVIQLITRYSLEGAGVPLVVREPGGRLRSLELPLAGLRLDDLAKRGFFEGLGVTPKRPTVPPVIGELEPGGPADRAGLLPGDRILSADGIPVSSWTEWVKSVRRHPEQTLVVAVEREGATVELGLRPNRISDEDGRSIGRIGAAVAVQAGRGGQELYAVERYPPVRALGKAVGKTWEVSALTLRMLWKMLMLEVSVENLSGPISIAQYAGQSAKVGLSRFLEFLGIVSISLGILNLLPVPILDGGHLMYYLIELFRGRPVSEEAQMLGQRVGLAFLIGLMGLAFFNDLTRLLG